MFSSEIRIHFKGRTIFSSTPTVFSERVSRNKKPFQELINILLWKIDEGSGLKAELKKKRKSRSGEQPNTPISFLNPFRVAGNQKQGE